LNPREKRSKDSIAMLTIYFALFCATAFSLVPLAIRFFIIMQIKIGNGEFFLIKWIQAHEQAVIYGFWIFFVIGLCIAMPAAIKDVFLKLKDSVPFEEKLRQSGNQHSDYM